MALETGTIIGCLSLVAVIVAPLIWRRLGRGAQRNLVVETVQGELDMPAVTPTTRGSTAVTLPAIPPYRKELLYISHEVPTGHAYGLSVSLSISDRGAVNLRQDVPDDPSTIYSMLPAVDAKRTEDVPPLPYFPAYSAMEPEQRGKYLRWLSDVTREIEIGYVFVYYYGLERQLLYGNFDAAFDEVNLLRRHHKNGSFQGYSASALVHSCLLKKRVDKLQELYATGFDYFGNSNLLMFHYGGTGIDPEALLLLAGIMPRVNRRYFKSKPIAFRDKVSEILLTRFGMPFYPLSSRFPLEQIERIPYPIFANISFPPEVRTPHLPNILRHPPFIGELNALFNEVHEAIKNLPKSRKLNAAKASETD